jgi:hypothetical protein
MPDVEHPWRVKQRQADAHLRRFADDCADYIREQHVGLRHETDAEAGTIRVRLHADAEPPLSLGATIGDVLHNLRSALDSVAWAACQRAGVPAKRDKDVYFPIGIAKTGWDELAAWRLPNVDPEHLEIFPQLQPWYWDDEARAHGINVPLSATKGHPLYRLHHLARIDRHRVPHPILARGGFTWLGHNDGTKVEAHVYRPDGALPGEVFVEWRVDPPGEAASVKPDGEVVLALADTAHPRRSALQELQAMQRAVADATHLVEIKVLDLVTSADLDRLGQLRQEFQDADGALRALVESDHIIDADHIERYELAAAAEKATRTAYFDLSRELFG